MLGMAARVVFRTVVAGGVSRPAEVRFSQGMPVWVDQFGAGGGVAVDRGGSAPGSVSVDQSKAAEWHS